MKKVLSLILAGLIAGSMALTAAAGNVFEEDQGKVAFGVKKATATWNPDGIYDAGEYYDIDVKDTWISTACGGDETQNAKTKALDVDVAMSYDDEYFYLYMSYNDPDGFKFTTVDNPNWWDGDIMQFGGSDADQTGDANRLEIGIGQYSDSGEKSTMNWADWLGSGYMVNGGNWNDDFEVTVDGNQVTYELRVPFSAFATVAPTVGAQYKICFCFGWSMENGGYNMWQLASGITGGKSIDNHATVTLEEAPVVETVAEEVVEDTAAAAPQTFDAGVIAAVAAIVSAAGYAISKKR